MSLSKGYAAVIAVLLLGYAFFDKSFAYLGVAPIYIGEIVLVIGVLVFVLGGVGSAAFRSPITIVLLFFVFWCFITMLPHIGRYGLLAARDSVIWSYSAYAIIVSGVLLRAGYVDRAISLYGRWLPVFLFWVPVGFAASQVYGGYLPFVPGSEVSILSLKGGDMAVHLAGAASFMGLGLHRWYGRPHSESRRLWEILLWGAWAAGFVATASQNRGGMVSIFAAMAVTMVFRPMGRLQKVMLVGIVLLTASLALDISIPTGGYRDISPRQVAENLGSVIFPDNQANYLSGSVEWRKRWWLTILDYTVFGEHRWFGKGYGVNLAVDDGFRNADGSLRSPHNGHLNILARSGVPGFLLWLILLGTIGMSLVLAHFRARRAGNQILADINLWVLAYWVAFVMNASFDVYLEGPQGGIWFWCLVGFSIALTRIQRVGQTSEAGKNLPAAGYPA